MSSRPGDNHPWRARRRLAGQKKQAQDRRKAKIKEAIEAYYKELSLKISNFNE